MNWPFTWALSPRSTCGCIQNDFYAYGTFGAHRATILCQDYHYLQTVWNEHQLELRHLGVPSGASIMITEPMVPLAQTMHISCTDTNTISKWTETIFHMTDVTKEFHWVHPKWILSLWYVWHKPWTYIASRLPLSPNRLNHASTWDSSPRSTIGFVQKNFWAYRTFGTNCAPILHWH
jgi:hypothetical protein